MNEKSASLASRFKEPETDSRKASVAEPIPRILVVDDEPMICQQLDRLYIHTGYEVEVVYSAEEALNRLEVRNIDLVVTDIRLGGMSGIELTKRIQEIYPDVPVIVITGYADVNTAVEVLKLGADDYIVKPFSAAAIQESTRLVLEKARVFTEIRHLRRSLQDRYEFGSMLSKKPEMHKVFETIRLVSGTDMTVLVEGETGTGKELVARAIHYHGPRREGPFVTINCSGFPETLLESELFGHERGAFTGADQSRPGKIEMAHGGTLFLDEIESMSLAMQAKLLRVLEDQKVQRLGSRDWVHISMRVIAASNVPLQDLLARGQVRRDFYYRINVIPIYLIPLRQRLEDIPLLVQNFLRHHPVAVQKGITGVANIAMSQLMDYSWPGNVRELQNVLERAIVLTMGPVIEDMDLPQMDSSARPNRQKSSPSVSLRQWLKQQEKQYLLEQLEACGGRIGRTARDCGVDIKTLYRKMRMHGLDKKAFQQRDHDTLALDDQNLLDPKNRSMRHRDS
jgi:DNA-binding NtrC family response regulator